MASKLESLPNSSGIVAQASSLPNGLAESVDGLHVSSHASQAQEEKGFTLEEHPIDELSDLKVAVIGAGISGITAGTLLPIKVPGVQLTIIEKNADVAGTWFENIFPGIRCDIPAHVYQSTFEPNTQWTEEYAQGKEIKEYWQGVARKHGVYQHTRLLTKVLEAEWQDQSSKWLLTLMDLKAGSQYEELFDVVVTAIGRFNAWKMPNYEGMETYTGHLRHSSNWDDSFKADGKTVAVIGNGASGIQVVPSLQKLVKRLDHYARSPTWIAGSFAGEGEGRKLEPLYFSQDQLQSFEDPDKYLKFRQEMEAKFYKGLKNIFKESNGNNDLRAQFKTDMENRLQGKPEIIKHIVPDFAPICRRLTPGPGYLEALTQDNVEFIPTPIARFTRDGIVTADGVERKVDAVICSTGANTDMLPPFPIKVPNVGTLQEAWSPDPYTYLGAATPSFPNLLFLQGPNGAGVSGTIPSQIETQVTYIAQLLRKVMQQRIERFSPLKEATDDFMEYCDSFFAGTVFMDGCRSWANSGRPGGRIHGHWPGSASHLNIVRRYPRWEDWAWKTKSTNRFAYLGNGWTKKETVNSSDTELVHYLKRPDDIDLRIYHEEWFAV
ncbi:MAG: hypothetical protein M1820_001285 [Bogoriella megaspora]|nr:MAG: hypothetical protein M1820_001285 [Bogoriella megaspora]